MRAGDKYNRPQIRSASSERDLHSRSVFQFKSINFNYLFNCQTLGQRIRLGTQFVKQTLSNFITYLNKNLKIASIYKQSSVIEIHSYFTQEILKNFSSSDEDIQTILQSNLGQIKSKYGQIKKLNKTFQNESFLKQSTQIMNIQHKIVQLNDFHRGEVQELKNKLIYKTFELQVQSQNIKSKILSEIEFQQQNKIRYNFANKFKINESQNQNQRSFMSLQQSRLSHGRIIYSFRQDNQDQSYDKQNISNNYPNRSELYTLQKGEIKEPFLAQQILKSSYLKN